MTLSDLQGDSPMAGLLKCNFSHTSVADDTISADYTYQGFSVMPEHVDCRWG